MPQGGALQVEEEEENNKEEEEGKVDKEEEDAEPLPAGEPAAPNRRWKPHPQERRSSEILKRRTTTSEEMRGRSLPRLHQVTRCTAAPDQLLAIL